MVILRIIITAKQQRIYHSLAGFSMLSRPLAFLPTTKHIFIIWAHAPRQPTNIIFVNIIIRFQDDLLKMILSVVFTPS